MADPINVTTENFDKAVLQSKGTAIVDLWASWCGPCRMLSPIIAQIANENPDIKVFKVNVDDEPDIASKYGVQAIPTVLIFKDGQEVNRSVGMVPKDKLLAMPRCEVRRLRTGGSFYPELKGDRL